MIAGALELAGGVLAVAGALFCIVGGIGLMRLPEFFSRTHAASVSDTLGATLILLGLVLYESARWFDAEPGGASVPVLLKLLLILAFIYVVSPTATHALAKAAFAGGIKADSPRGAPGDSEL